MGKGSKRRPENSDKIAANWDRAMYRELWCPICGMEREPFHEICKACEETFSVLTKFEEIELLVKDYVNEKETGDTSGQ